MPEAGRAIIRDQVAIAGTSLPWSDRAAVAELMLAWELRSWYEAHSHAGPVIFDRGVPMCRAICAYPAFLSRPI